MWTEFLDARNSLLIWNYKLRFETYFKTLQFRFYFIFFQDRIFFCAIGFSLFKLFNNLLFFVQMNLSNQCPILQLGSLHLNRLLYQINFRAIDLIFFLFQMLFICSHEKFGDPNPNVEFSKSRIRKKSLDKKWHRFQQDQIQENERLKKPPNFNLHLQEAKWQNDELQLVLVNETREKVNLAKELM